MSKTKKKKKILLAEFRKMKPETQERFEIGNKTSKQGWLPRSFERNKIDF